MEWIKLGSLSHGISEPRLAVMKGTYMLIFPGKPRRIYYVGTTMKGFSDRPGSYWIDYYQKGKSLVFRASTHEDIYQFMVVPRAQRRNDYHRLIRFLAGQDLVWVPEDEEISPLKNWQDRKWPQFLEQSFSSMELWGCEVAEKEDAEEIESRLQIALGQLYRLGYYNEIGNRQNWLGQQKKRGKLKYGIKLDFSKENIRSLGLDIEDMKAFDENENRKMIEDYFSKEDDLSSPF